MFYLKCTSRRFTMARTTIHLFLIHLGYLISKTAAFKSLGCYVDMAGDLDMPHSKNVSDYKVETCVSACLQDGYPYAGLQPARQCYCNTRYGKHGTATDCTTDCGSAGYTCGGTNKNNVYYTVKDDGWKGKHLEYGFKTDSKTFDAARQECVKPSTNGELAAVTDQATLDAIVAKMTAGTNAWIGIWKRNTYFAYVDELRGNFSVPGLWATSFPTADECVFVDQAVGKLKTGTCSTERAYVCETIKPTTVTDPNPSVVKTSDPDQAIKDWFKNSTNITLYIVMPIFGLCYGGSCLLYAFAKLYRNCRKKQRQKMLAQSRVDLLSDMRTIQPVKTLKATNLDNDHKAHKPLTKSSEKPPAYENNNVTFRKKENVADAAEKSALIKSQSSSPDSNRSDSQRVRTPVDLFVANSATSGSESRVSSGDSDKKGRLRTPLQTSQVKLEDNTRNNAMVSLDSDGKQPKFKDAAITMRDQYFYMKALEIAARRRREEEHRENRDDEVYDDSVRFRPPTSSSSASKFRPQTGDQDTDAEKRRRRRRKDHPSPVGEVDECGRAEEDKPRKKKKVPTATLR